MDLSDAEVTGDDRVDALTVIQQMRAGLDHTRPQVSWSALGAALGSPSGASP